MFVCTLIAYMLDSIRVYKCTSCRVLFGCNNMPLCMIVVNRLLDDVDGLLGGRLKRGT